MKSLPTYLVVLLIALAFPDKAYSQLRLPAIVGSNMVLQRDAEVNLWGWAAAGSEVTVLASWRAEAVTARTGKDGKWEVALQTTNDREPQTLTVRSEGNEIVLENVALGEVWLCSGQSNMEQPLRGYTGQPTYGGQLAAVQARNPDLRLFTVQRQASEEPQQDVAEHSPWAAASPHNTPSFSAVAYFFGQQLQQTLDVPVGLIHTSWGGSDIRAWMSTEMLSATEEVIIDPERYEAAPQRTPTVLYNAMIAPLIPYTVRGMLWYQGESNRQEPAAYQQLFPAMVADWRERWGQGDFPFYYVQIAPYRYDTGAGFNTVENTAFLREAQLKSLDRIPNSGMAVTLDVGDYASIHPPKKKEVAERLLFQALHHTYGYASIDPSGPIFSALEKQDKGLLLRFDYASEGLYTFGELSGFEIAGADRVFHPAQARIVNRRQVLVESERVPDPVAVRYGWANFTEASLFDANLLPASSFRTDNWTDARRASQE